MNSFNNFNLDTEILKSLDILDYKIPSQVQSMVIPVLIDKKDILVKSKTGTGKSAAFAIPICNKIKKLENKLKALVIVPTRELALQVKEEIEKIGRLKMIKCSVILGKEPLKNQILELKQGTNVIVATPGRMIDHISRGSVDLGDLDYFIIDEVDKMFTKGFETDINTIMKNIPNTSCKAFFSATVDDDLKEICNGYMKDYEYIETTIIFTNTKKQAEVLYENMKSEGFLVEQIHGDISQERRFYIIDSFKKHEFNILISSDIISRGIHIDDVSLVINYDIPSDSEIYVHRIGRTGRAGKCGKAISLVSNNECRDFENIEVYTKNKIEVIDIEYCEKDKIEYQKTIKELLNKYALLENQEQDEFKGEVVKIHISIGKKKKIRIGDIVGALSNIDGLENSDLGVIKIYDNYSTVDILNQKGKKFLNDYKEIIVKNKKAKIREEK